MGSNNTKDRINIWTTTDEIKHIKCYDTVVKLEKYLEALYNRKLRGDGYRIDRYLVAAHVKKRIEQLSI